MDSDDEQIIRSKLRNLEEDGETRVHLLKQQVSAMRSNYDTITKPIQEIISDEIKIKSSLENWTSDVNKNFDGVKNEIAELNRETRILSYMSALNTKLLSLKSRQSLEIAIVHDLVNGKIHEFLLPESVLNDFMNNLKDNFKINKKFLD